MNSTVVYYLITNDSQTEICVHIIVVVMCIQKYDLTDQSGHVVNVYRYL